MEFTEVKDFLQSRIIQLLDSSGLSMNQLSRLIGKSPDYIQKVLSGKLIPPLYVIVDICNAFDITINELFDIGVLQPEKHHQIVALIEHLPEKKLDGLILLLTKE